MTNTTNNTLANIEATLTLALVPSVKMLATNQITGDQLNTMAAGMVGVNPCVYAKDVGTGKVIDFTVFFSAYYSNALSERDLAEALISTYLYIKEGSVVAINQEEVQPAQAVDTNTQNKNNGGVQMNTNNQTGFATKEDIIATFNAGNMTAEEFIVAIELFNNQAQQQVPNAIGQVASGVTQIATGAIGGVGQMIGALTGTVQQMSSQIGGNNLMGKVKQGADTALDRGYGAIGVGINTTNQMAKGAVVVGTQVGSQVIHATASIADSLLKASGEIANTLIDGLTIGAHQANNGMYKVGKSLTGGDIPVCDEAAELMKKYGMTN